MATAIRAARDKKAQDVDRPGPPQRRRLHRLLRDLHRQQRRQITAIADSVRETLKSELDERPALTEGVDRSEWILLDYFNFVVHVFSRECRAFYGLERLWGNAERHEFSDEAHP